LCERSAHQNKPLVLSLVEPGGHLKQLIRHVTDKIYLDFNKETGEVERDPLTQQVIGCASEVHRNLGPGLLESTYEKCIGHELKLAELSFINQASMLIDYEVT
jgi:hypothetical protein